jgi:hypothetical protein
VIERPWWPASEGAAASTPETETCSGTRRRRLGRRFPTIISSAGGCYAKLESMRTRLGGQGDVTGDDDGMSWPVADGGSSTCGDDERDHATGLGLAC